MISIQQLESLGIYRVNLNLVLKLNWKIATFLESDVNFERSLARRCDRFETRHCSTRSNSGNLWFVTHLLGKVINYLSAGAIDVPWVFPLHSIL